jgi:UDP-2,3-diacylglucosamine hydrolase
MTTDARRGFTADSLVAIVAGEGQLPLDIARKLSASGVRLFVVLCGRRTETAPDLLSFDHFWMPLEEALGLGPVLKRRGATHAVLAGAVVRRPHWTALRPKWRLLSLAATAVRTLRRGDDGLLRFVVRYFEKFGIAVLGAHELVPDLIARAGCMTRLRPTAADERDLRAAFRAARALGAVDVGQAAVAIGGRAIAVEGIEGTDGLLERVQALRGHGRLADAKRGALVKCAKPQQELRADLPTIGPDTVTRAAQAGLAGIGVEAERSLILEKGRTIEEANRLGLFVVGLEPR